MNQYGQRVYTLSELVDRFNLKQGNDKGRYYTRMLLFAEWAWKDIFQGTLWEIKQVAIQVCKGEVKLPDDCKQLLTVAVVDEHKHIKSLTFNPNISTLDMKCVQNCSCERCEGKNTLCAVNDNMTVVTEMVDIHDVEYLKTTYTRVNSLGEIQTDEHTPMWDVETSAVVYQDVQKSVGSVEVDNKGCIVNNPRNIESLKTHCHSVLDAPWWYENATADLDPADYNYFGHWNWNAASRDIIHIFGNASKIVIGYRTSAEKGLSEMIIPEDAEMAVHAGMMYQQMIFDPKDRDRGMTGLNRYRQFKLELTKLLNPVPIEAILKLQTRPRLR